MQYKTLEERYNELIKENIFNVEKMFVKEEKKHYVFSFYLSNNFQAVYFLYIDNNIEKAKNCYYEAAMAYSYYHEVLKYNFFSTLGVPSVYLLCDNPQIITRFCQYTDSPEMVKVGPLFYQIGKAIQAVLLDDQILLLSSIEMLKKRTKSGIGKYFLATVDFFEGLVAKDEEKVYSAVNAFQKRTQSQQPLILKDYFSLEATGLAKLAWRKGYEIDFKNKFIPQDLLPIKELEHYESFDFFKEPE